GGNEEVLLKLLGSVFDRDVTIGQFHERDSTRPLVAKSRGKHPFTGKLVVLVDSDSASAAEIFARVVQLEKRGTVVGDRSSGYVMRAREFTHSIGGDMAMDYGAMITVADLVMGDGKSLEHSGVTPDEFVIPTPEDLAAGKDPALAKAMELVE